MIVLTEERLTEVIHTVNKIYAGKCMNEHAARSILSNIIHLLGSRADINECEVKYHKGIYLNSFFIKIRGDSILFTIDITEDNHIKKFDYTKPTFIQWLNENNEEGTKMSEEYKPLIEVLEDLKEGDVLDVPSNVMNITVVNTQLVWQDVAGELGSPVDFNLARLKTPVRIQPRYVGWQEAFEAYENGYTIMCEYKGDMLELNRDLVTLQERSLLSDRELVGLLTTKWIIK